MLLYKAIIVTTFGRNSPRPFRAAMYRLGLLYAIAIGVSWFVSRTVSDVPVIPTADGAYLLFTAAYVLQLAVLFVLLAALGITRSSNSDSLARLLLVLPVGRTMRWTALLLPSFILAAITALLVGWPLATILSKAGLPVLLLIAGGTGGVVAALGILHGIPRPFYWVQIAGAPLLLWAEYTLITAINSPMSSAYAKAGASVALSLLFGLCWLLFWRSKNHLAQDISRNTPGRNVSGTSLPAGWWFIKKIARAKTTRLGFVTAFGTSLVGAVFLSRHDIDPPASAMLASILTATFVSDIRSLAAHSNPAEIAGVRATMRFVTAHAACAVVCGIAAVSPLIAVSLSAEIAGHTLLALSVQLFFGISAGVFAGTLVVPARRDITGQLVATLLCTGILISAPYLPAIHSLDDTAAWLYQIPLSLALLVGAGHIEYQRNRYNWRKKSWKNR